MMKYLWLCLLWVMVAWGNAVDIYPFEHADDKARFDTALHRYRCVVCQNQSLADSNAPVALDIKQTIYQAIRSGHSDQQLDAFLVDHYGAFIRLTPVASGASLLLWLLPIVLVIIAVAALWRLYTQRGGS